MRRWISDRTLFSCPDVVWTAYQRCSTFASLVCGSADSAPEQQLRELFEREVLRHLNA